MQEFLYKYLVLYHKLCIPGIGCFSIINESAQIDETNGLIFPPRPVIHFALIESTEIDKQLINFLTEEMNIDEELANKEFQDFCSLFTTNLHEQNLALLPGIGRLNKGSSGNIRFTPETNLLEFLPPIDIEKNIRVASKKTAKPAAATEYPEAKEEKQVEEIEEEGKVKDPWWKYAVALIVIGVVALLLYS